MTEFQFAPSHKIRIWVEQIPKLTCDVGGYINDSLVAHGLIVKERQLVGVELCIRTGTRSLYGFLVGEFLPVQAEELMVRIATTNKLGDIVDWSLLRKLDQVFVGLPVEYGKGIIQGLLEINAGCLLGSGVLQFDFAAHSPVGSSEDIFRRLARLIVYLLSNQGDLSNQAKIRDLLELG